LTDVPSDIARAEEDYGNMATPEALDADDIDGKTHDKYLKAELIFDVGTGNERKGRVVRRAKRAYGKSFLVARILIPYSTLVNMLSSLPMDLPRTISQMSSQSVFMKGKSVIVSSFVDANHAGNVIMRRSHTGILIYVQNAPILWFSKRQNTVKSSSFGSEFVILRTAKDMLVALRYNLQMFGVPIDGPTNVFCDNNGVVVKNTTIPESMLAKKHNSIKYHAIREAVAARIIRVGKEVGMTNLADLFTKVLTADRRRALCCCIMY
jgi:hypothetical protein